MASTEDALDRFCRPRDLDDEARRHFPSSSDRTASFSICDIDMQDTDPDAQYVSVELDEQEKAEAVDFIVNEYGRDNLDDRDIEDIEATVEAWSDGDPWAAADSNTFVRGAWDKVSEAVLAGDGPARRDLQAARELHRSVTASVARRQ